MVSRLVGLGLHLARDAAPERALQLSQDGVEHVDIQALDLRIVEPHELRRNVGGARLLLTSTARASTRKGSPPGMRNITFGFVIHARRGASGDSLVLEAPVL